MLPNPPVCGIGASESSLKTAAMTVSTIIKTQVQVQGWQGLKMGKLGETLLLAPWTSLIHFQSIIWSCCWGFIHLHIYKQIVSTRKKSHSQFKHLFWKRKLNNFWSQHLTDGLQRSVLSNILALCRCSATFSPSLILSWEASRLEGMITQEDIITTGCSKWHI